jgi:hypothetical protein
MKIIGNNVKFGRIRVTTLTDDYTAEKTLTIENERTLESIEMKKEDAERLFKVLCTILGV